MDFHTGNELLTLCVANNLPISEVMLRREETILETDRDESLVKMRHSYAIMKQAVRQSLDHPRHSMGGLIGGEAERMNARRLTSGTVCGDVTAKAAAYAMGVLEVNASMGLIVAAPTAGSSGVIPGVFLAVQERYDFPDDVMVNALFHSAALGYLIMRNATVSGAQGGCQAEVGSASAMAASAVTELMGGTPARCLSAASIALSNLLGLVCDPVAGLVEAPCQQRNAIGAANALISAEISLSGVDSVVPFDEMVEAAQRVGQRIPIELRETALGGMAVTPTACSLCDKMSGRPICDDSRF